MIGRNLSVLILFSCLLVGCHKGNKEIKFVEYLTIEEELPIFFANKDSATLIPDFSMRDQFLLLNSQEEVRNSFSSSFLEAYPSYLDVAFDKHTLLVRTASVFYTIVKRKISVYWDPKYDFYQYYVSYNVGELCKGDDYFIERTAVVVKKMDKNTIIEPAYSIGK